jgi:hypothetical protein
MAAAGHVTIGTRSALCEVAYGRTAKGGDLMVAQFVDTVTGTAVYVNPTYVVSLRPDPADPDHISIVRLRDGESIRVKGDHREVAEKLAKAF